jgi:hypothetical protein
LNHFFATDATAIADDGFASFGGITFTETVLPLAADFRWLILSFHVVPLFTLHDGEP